jgi:tetratricopeptide (TPR) repeat protein
VLLVVTLLGLGLLPQAQSSSTDLESQVAQYRAFLAQHPKEVAVHSNLGVLLSHLGRFDEAISEYRKGLELEPGNISLELNLGLAYYKSGRIADASELFSKIQGTSTKNPQVILLLADCQLRMGQNDKVIALLRPVEKDHPDDLAIAYLLGTALIRANQVQEGQKFVDRILRNGDSAESRFLLGSQMFASGDFPAAVQQFVKAIELNPSVPSLQSFYGQALLNTGDPNAAAAAFQKELASNPNEFEANLYLAEILIHRKQWTEAASLLTRALLVRPDSVEAKQDLASANAHQDLAPGITAQTGPHNGEKAPDITVTRQSTGKPVKLAQLLGQRPIVLVFGSYTCPNFRAAADTLNKFHTDYKTQADFYLIYIREAHSTADWQSTRNQREGITLKPVANMGERQEHAALCLRKLKLDFPAMLDGMDGAAEKAYSAWPSKAYVIDRAGNVVFSTGLSELEFKPDQLLAAIQKTSAPAQDPAKLVQDAIAKQRAGDLEGAAKEYREFLKAHPEAAAIHSNLGAALAGLGQFSQAVDEYKIALKQSPGMPGVALNLALAYYKMGRVSDAAAQLAKSHANNQATLLLADCYLRMGRNADVVALLQPLQHDHPDDLAIAYLLGTALIRDNKPEQGQVLVDRILRNGESAEAHLMLGSAKMQIKDFAGARDEFARAAALNPNAPDVHVLYAQALQVTGDQDGALKEFKAELAADPYNFDSNLEMGVLLRQDEKFPEALAYLNRALDVRPGDLAVRYQIATILLSEGKVDEARKDLESIIKESPQFTEAHVSLATVYYRLKMSPEGNRERAIVQKLTAEAQAKQPGVKSP